jgi:hypothetical protein
VRVEWPSGIVQELTNVGVNQVLTVIEPSQLSVAPGENGAVELSLRGGKGFAYEIQWTEDCRAWSPLSTVTNSSGNLRLLQMTGTTHRAFYRAREL